MVGEREPRTARRRRRRHNRPAPPRGHPVLLASEGGPFSPEAIEVAARTAEEADAAVRVFSIARIWGTSLGLAMPGLLPTNREWDEQRKLVRDAVQELRRRGLQADGHVVGTRNATKAILAEARRLGSQTIVMGADPPRPRLLADLMWSQEPQRVRRRARQPVHLVEA